MPPPMHSVARPFLASRLAISCSSVTSTRAPDAPIGWPIAFLRQLIRFYGDSMQALVPRYLEFSMEHLTQDQNKIREQMSKAFGTGAIDALQAQTRANMAMFTEAFRLFNPFAAAAAAKGRGEAPAQGENGELSNLKRELNEMRERLDKLAKDK